MTEELKKARDRVLVDNTAQAVFKHLDRLEDNRARLGLRWIWELLQNARDSARTDGVHITVRLSESELCFEHDGKPFDSAEIAHLVYHGSTKTESFDNVGQFGSGFLSTHLLSRVVRVEGCLNDSRGFVFSLDRTSGTVEELRLAMDRSWEAFEQSVEDTASGQPSITSFVYVIAEQVRKLAQKGLDDLYRCGPLVLAFCPEIASIAVETAEAAWSLERGDREPLHEGSVLSIQEQQDGQTLSRFVAVTEGAAELCAALQVCPSESSLRLDQLQEPAPKLFILFPLIGSERLGLPVTINSKRFKPHEDRDGIILTGESTGAQENWRLLKDSVGHQVQLLEWCAKEKWSGAERLLAFDITRLPDWVGENQWFIELLTDLVRSARTTPLMPTLGGDWINPKDAWIPITDNESHKVRLWDLMSSWSGAPARLPCRDHLDSWSSSLSNWAQLLRKSPSEMDEALTTDEVARLISKAESVEGLQERLASGESLPWLISLLQLLQEADDTGLFDKYNLLPSQAGHLRRRADLRRDEGISEELKDIAKEFDLDIRNELLNASAEGVDGIVDLLGSERESELLDQLLACVKEKCRDDTIDSSLAPWVVKLFWWMIAQADDYLDRLDGYPAPTTDVGGDRTTVLYLAPGCDASDRPMAPLATWPEGAQKFASLFPKRKILAEAFADRDPDRWRPLVKRGYVNMSPLIETKRAMNAFLPDYPLPETDGIDSHESTQEIQVSDIILLNEKDIGLIDTARKSKTRATEFIRFLVEFVIATDDRAFEESSVDCECEQSHKIYRAAWLVPLHRRQWVPLESTGRRAARASAESLARLLADSPDIAELLLGERGEKLLRALGISRADLALRAVADDEETRVALIHSMKALAEATDGNVDRVRDLANEIREHPEIIDSIEEQKVRRKKIQRNQDIGLIVENLLRQELEGRGLTVQRTGRGSDFEVESDYVKNNEEVWLELVDSRVSTFIEVKSTRVDQVKMTPLQVESACSLDDRFALCVVPLDDDAPTRQTISENLRVVFAIGVHLKSALADYKSLRGAADEARRPQGPHDAIEIEIIEGQVRFQIGRSIWGDALTFEQAVDRFAGRGVTSVDKASSPDQDPM